jgi:hypothetical protein
VCECGCVVSVRFPAFDAVAFNDFVPTAFNISGISVSFVGAALFSAMKLQEMRAQQPKQATTSTSVTLVTTADAEGAPPSRSGLAIGASSFNTSADSVQNPVADTAHVVTVPTSPHGRHRTEVGPAPSPQQ